MGKYHKKTNFSFFIKSDLIFIFEFQKRSSTFKIFTNFLIPFHHFDPSPFDTSILSLDHRSLAHLNLILMTFYGLF